MNKYHKYRSKSGTLPGWIRIGALALGAGVGAGDWTQGGQTQYAKADGGIPRTDETKKDTEHIHTATVNVALQNRCLNFENANIFLPKTLFFVLLAVALLYFARKKSKTDNNG